MVSVDKIMAYESGDMSLSETLDMFVELANTGALSTLQGSYGRTFMEFRSAGMITFDPDQREWVIAPEADEIW